MENVAKALLLAGAVLIGVLLLGNYTNSMKKTSTYTEQYMEKVDNSEIRKYNSDFTKNVGNELNMYEVVSLINKALYIDEDCGFDKKNENYIKVTLKFKNTSDNHDDIISDFFSNTSQDYNGYHDEIYRYLEKYYDNSIKLESGVWKKEEYQTFNITIDSYHTDGKIHEVTFTQK